MAASAYQAEFEAICPVGWKVVPLADVVFFQEGPGILAEDFQSVGVPLIRLKGVEGDFVSLDGCNFLAPEKVESKWGHFRLKRGDLVISTSASFGRVSEVTEESEGAIPYTGLIRFRPKNKEVDAGFLRAFLSSSVFMRQVEAMASGSVIRHFGPMHLKQMALPLPPIDEQYAIGNIAKNIAKLLRNKSQTNEILEGMARALFNAWFVDFEPVRAKLENRWRRGQSLPGLPEGIYDLFPSQLVDSELGQIPDGWWVGELGPHLDVLETGRRPKGGVAGICEGVPSVGAESIIGVGQFDFGKTKYVSEEFFSAMTSGHAKSMDVMLYKDGGKPGDFRPRVSMFGRGFPFERYAINEHVFRMRSKSIGQVFLYLQISHERILNDLRNRGGKAAIPGINQGDVKSLAFVTPSREALAMFDKVAIPMMEGILERAVESRFLAQLRDTLLPRLMSGELRVPDAERIIGAAV